MSICPACGIVFRCCMVDVADAESVGEPAAPSTTMGDNACWCGALPPIMPLPTPDGAKGGCYCPACLRLRLAARSGAA